MRPGEKVSLSCGTRFVRRASDGMLGEVTGTVGFHPTVHLITWYRGDGYDQVTWPDPGVVEVPSRDQVLTDGLRQLRTRLEELAGHPWRVTAKTLLELVALAEAVMATADEAPESLSDGRR